MNENVQMCAELVEKVLVEYYKQKEHQEDYGSFHDFCEAIAESLK